MSGEVPFSYHPVVECLQHLEVIISGNNCQDAPGLVGLNGRCMFRLSPTKEQREMLKDGADLFLSVMTTNNLLQPFCIQVAYEMDSASVVEALELVP